MKDANGTIVGIRLRRLDGSKYAVTGSHNGLFIPKDQTFSDRLLVCEGPTDCAALLSLGFWCIGRPCCKGGTEYTVRYVRSRQPEEVVVVADNDDMGQEGAEALIQTLLGYCQTVRLVTPPAAFKDIRAWLIAGGSHQDLNSVIDEATVRSLSIGSLQRKEVS